MKKFLLLCVMLFFTAGCFEDIVENCPTDAVNHCGQFGGYIDVCHTE